MIRLMIPFLLACSIFQTGCVNSSRQDSEQNSLIRAGDRVHAAGDPDSAIKVYESALKKNPSNRLPLYLKLGEAYMQAEKIEEAKKVYEEALPYDENDEVKKQLGRLYLSTGQSDSAISIFEKVLAFHRDDLKAHNGLGVAHDLKGEHALAQDCYHKALLVNGENRDVQGNLGLSLSLEGKYEESLKWLKPIGERLGATSRQRHNLAFAYALAGDHAKAKDLFEQDMDAMDINKNIQILNRIEKPSLPLKNQPDHEEGAK